MIAYLDRIKLFLKQIGLVFFIYFLCRFIFFIINYKQFSSLDFFDTLKLFVYGIRFDAFSISVSNAIFIIISILPFKVADKKWIQKINVFLFIVFNAIFILSNSIDFGYYSFIKKRSTFDILNQVFGGQTDVKSLLPTFIKDFWYVVFIYILLMYLFVRLNKSLLTTRKPLTGNYTLKQKVQICFICIFIIGTTFVSFRGLARVPIQLIDAGQYAKAQYVDIVLNSPCTILLTMDKINISEIHEVNEQVAYNTVNPIKEFKEKTFTKKNVVVIILESFSKEYTGLSKRKSYTPFFDSLMSKSLVFNNAIANGGSSIEGIPAVVSSLPNLMFNPYINSTYSSNKLTNFASILNNEGYQTSFFHGGTNGTMNFDSYTSLSGFDNYYGRIEYNNETDYDGNWGIWDEPFLNFTAQTLNSYTKPFFATVFTLSSHHPFKVPNKYAGKFPKTSLEIIESIGYTDYALAKFFETAKKMKWYNNTLFVLVADHTSISNDEFYNNDVGHHQIPIVFFEGNDSLKGINNKPMQQIDIMPSVLDYIGYNKPFFSFGNSIFDNKSSRNAIYFNSGNYYLTNDSLYFVFNNLQLQQVYRYKNDSLLKNNIYTEGAIYKQQQDYLKAYVQFYNYALINNKTH